jgi:two-component system, NarL family, response regulator DevR
MKILIVDPCDSFRQEIVYLLRRQPDLEVVSDGNLGPGMIEHVFLNRPDIVLMGSTLFEAEGKEIMHAILSQRPETAFIVLAPVDSLELFLKALRYGARGCLPQNISETALTRSLYAVERGELAVSRSMMATVVSELRRILQAILASENHSLSTLPAKDVQILHLLATEASHQEIARHLLISDKILHIPGIHQEARQQREGAKFAQRVGVKGGKHLTD